MIKNIENRPLAKGKIRLLNRRVSSCGNIRIR
jgi:hypothetical protein